MQTLSTYFFPLVLGYGIPCLLWYLIYKYRPSFWPTATIEKPDKAARDLIYALIGGIGILGIGQLWRVGVLVPNTSDNKALQFIVWWVNNLIIFSPIFIVLKLRKQSLNTIFLNRQGLPLKLGFGLSMTVVGVEIYMLFNGGHVGEVLVTAFKYENIKNFLPVFLEGVALAFLFVRLKWTFGLKWAIGIPAVLFSLAHIPRALANDSALELVIMDSILTAMITVIVFSTTAKSRDIIWLGLLHYFMDIAIGAFG